MRFHGLMLVRDEADVLAQTLEHLLTWLDGLYILDMGSVDGTWDLIQDVAGRDRRVQPLGSRPVLFHDSLRSYVFDQVRSRFSPGDWVARVDGDEFYHVLPPQFIADRLRGAETAIHLQWYYFRLTQQEVAAYESGQVSIAQDRTRPITDRRRFYKVSTYPEPRLFRYRRGMRWPSHTNGPYNAGLVARERIPIRHYPHRDPLQMEQRFRLRSAMMKLSASAGNHWRLDDWRKELVDERGVSRPDAAHAAAPRPAAKVGLAGEAGIDTGPLLYWPPGTPLPEVHLYNHLPAARVRLAQRLTHAMMLPVLDRTRARFDPSFKPTDLPESVIRELAATPYGSAGTPARSPADPAPIPTHSSS